MFMNNYSHKGGIRINAITYLSDLGLPCQNIFKRQTIKSNPINPWNTAKIKFNVEEDKDPVKIFRTKIFNVPLKKLHRRNVSLKTGQKLKIPTILQEMCDLILRNVETEGIFQRTGSRIKQDKIKRKIEESGHLMDKNLNVVDVAAVLRYFLRTLPQPLIPYTYHELLLECCNSKDKRDMLLIAILLLPMENLNVLTYLMQFFHDIASYSRFNKMDTHKLAMCIASDILPVCTFSHGIFNRTKQVISILIDEAYGIGVLTADVQKRLAIEGRTDFDKDKDTRIRSMLSGFKKFLCHMS